MQTIKKRGKLSQTIHIEDAKIFNSETVLSPRNLPSNLILHLKKMPVLEYSLPDS